MDVMDLPQFPAEGKGMDEWMQIIVCVVEERPVIQYSIIIFVEVTHVMMIQ